MPRAKTAATGEDPVAEYKTLLREMIDRRPSGTRQKIAEAIGKHKSFVSQITNPVYAMPVPARHLGVIFDLCHFSQAEQRKFLAAYARAHPRRALSAADAAAGETTQLVVDIPQLSDVARQADLVESIRSYARHVSALAEKWERRESSPPKSPRQSRRATKERSR